MSRRPRSERYEAYASPRLLPNRAKRGTIGNSLKRKRLLANTRKRRFRAKRKAKDQLFANVRTYEDLVAALRLRRIELGITQMDLDEIAGFQSGYVGKLEVGYKEGGRGMGAMSMTTWLDALGVQLIIAPRDGKTGVIGSGAARAR